jgi:hypothetical protein
MMSARLLIIVFQELMCYTVSRQNSLEQYFISTIGDLCARCGLVSPNEKACSTTEQAFSLLYCVSVVSN